MPFFRHKWLVALFFCLISFGQAYPYSYAWAMGQQEECGCNLSGRKCIHGCDLKKGRKGHAHGSDLQANHHEHSGHDHSMMADHSSSHHGKNHVTHQASFAEDFNHEDMASVWVNPDCSRQRQREVLSFRGDPFLPQQAGLVFQPSLMSFEMGQGPRLHGVPSVLDPPPPRV